MLFFCSQTLFAQATFDKQGDKITVAYLDKLQLTVSDQGTVWKAAQAIVGSKDVSKLKAEGTAPVHSLSLNGFDISSSFLTGLDSRKAASTTTLPLDLTPILDKFLNKYSATDPKFQFPKDSRLILTGLEFKKDLKSATGQIILVAPKKSGEWYIFANSQVQMDPAAVGFQDLKMYLTETLKSDIGAFPFNYKKSLNDNVDKGSFAQLSCSGFEGYNVLGEYTFDPRQLSPKWTHQEITTSGRDTLNRKAKAEFVINGKELKYFQDAKITKLDALMVFGYENFVISLDSGYVHASAKNIKSSHNSSAAPLIGFEFKQLNFEMVGFRKGKGSARKMMSIKGKDFRFTHKGGLEGHVYEKAFLKMGQEQLSGWDYSIDSIEFKFVNNNANTALVMRGEIKLPICKDSTFQYRGDFGFDKNKFIPTMNFEATRASQGKTFPIDFWRINMRLETSNTAANSTIGMNWFGDAKDWYAGEFEPSADLNGVFEIDWNVEAWKKLGLKKAPPITARFPNVIFKGLKINNAALSSTSDCGAADALGMRNMGIEAFELGTNGTNTPGAKNVKTFAINDLPLSIRDINFRCLKDNKDIFYKMDFEVHVNLFGTDKTKAADKNNLVNKTFTNDNNNKKQTIGARGRSKKLSADEWKKFTAGQKATSGKSKASDITAVGQFALWGKVNDNGGIKSIVFDENKWPVEALYMSGQISNVYIAGGFAAFNELENEIHGNGFKGFLNAEIELGKAGAKLGGTVVAQFGSSKNKVVIDPGNGNVQTQKGTESYRYGFIDGEVVYSKGVHIAKGLFFNGGGLSFAYNMRKTALSDDIALEQTAPDKQRNEAVKTSDPPPAIPEDSGPEARLLKPGESLTSAVYYPSKGMYSGSVKGVFSWGKAVDTDERPPKLTPIAAFDFQLGVELEETPGNGSGVGLSKIWFEGNAYLMPEGITFNDRRDCAQNLTLQLEYDHLKKQISGTSSVPPPWQGSAQLYFELPKIENGGLKEIPKFFVKAGRPPHVGDPLKMETQLPWYMKALPIKPQLELYFQLGWDLDGIPPLSKVIPNWTDDTAMNPRTVGEDQMKNGNGVAFGLKASIPEDPYDFLMFRASMYAGLGFDLSLQYYPPRQVKKLSCGDGKNFGVNNWYARGQAYAYMAGKMDIRVNTTFYEGTINIFDFYIAAAIRAELPNPNWMLARVKGKYSVLNGLVEGSVNFKFEIGERCGNLQGNPVAGINVIQEVIPNDDAKDVPIFQNPIVVFTVPVAKVFVLATDKPDGTSETKTYKAVVESFKLDNGANGKVTIADDYRSATLNLDKLLKAHATYNYEVTIKWQLKDANGNWNDFKHQGKVVTEIEKGKFETGARPEKIMADALEYQAPGYDQRYWHKGYAKAQLIFKQSGWEYLFPKDSDKLKKALKENIKGSKAANDARKADLAKIDKLPPGISFAYKVRITRVQGGNTQDHPLDKYPGDDVTEEKPYVSGKTGANLQYEIPIVETNSVSGKAVIFDKINSLIVNLDKNYVYKLEILREPSGDYQKITTTDAVKVDKDTTAVMTDTDGNKHNFGATVNKKVSKVDKSKLGGDDLLYKTLYEYHFGMSKFDNLADKLKDYNVGGSREGVAKTKWDHPKDDIMPIWKVNNKNVVANRGDDYHQVSALNPNRSEPIDKYDEVKIIKNMKLTYPFVKKDGTYRGQADYWEKGGKKAGTRTVAEIAGGHPWEKEVYAPDKSKVDKYGYGWASTSDYYSLPAVVHICGHSENKKFLNEITAGGMDGTKFSAFATNVFRPYYEEKAAGNQNYVRNMTHWAFRLRFNKGLKNRLEANEITNGKTTPYEPSGVVDGLSGNRRTYFAFEDGRERILLSQFQMLKKIGYYADLGNWRKGTWPHAKVHSWVWGETLKHYQNHPGIENISVSGEVKWEFPNIRNWDRFDQTISDNLRETSPKVEFQLKLNSNGYNHNKDADKPIPYTAKTNHYGINIQYPKHLDNIEEIYVFNSSKHRTELYFNAKDGEMHTWKADASDNLAKAEANFGNTALDYSDYLPRIFEETIKKNQSLEISIKFSSGWKRVELRGQEKKDFRDGKQSTHAATQPPLHLKMDENPKTNLTDFSLAGQPNSGLGIKALTIYDTYSKNKKRLLYWDGSTVSIYENEAIIETKSSDGTGLIKFNKQKYYTIYLETKEGYKVKSEIGFPNDYWTNRKKRIPLYKVMNTFDDCYLQAPNTPVTGKNLALKLTKDSYLEINLDKSLPLTKSFSMDFWLKREKTGVAGDVFNGYYGELFSFTADDKIMINSSIKSKDAFADKEWHHYLFSYDHIKQKIQIYRDMKLVIEEAKSNFTAQDHFYLGKRGSNGTGFEGQIDAFRLWQKTFSTGKERAKLAQKSTGIPGLVEFDFEEGTGNAPKNKGTFTSKNKIKNIICEQPWVVADYSQQLKTAFTDLAYQPVNNGLMIDYNMPTNASGTTIEFWAKTDSKKTFKPQEYLFAKKGAFSLNAAPDGKMKLTMGSEVIAPNKIIFKKDDQWHHYSIVLDQKNQQRTIYVDGKEAFTEKKVFTIANNNNPLQIGFGDGGNAEVFHGLLDNFRVLNVPRTAKEVGETMNMKVSSCPTVLPINFDFTESIIANNGWSADADCFIETKTKSLACIIDLGDYVLDFDGNNPYIDGGHINNLTSFTIESWIKVDKFTDATYIFGKEHSDVKILITSKKEVRFAVDNSVTLIGHGRYPADNKWHHLAATCEKGEMKLYLDGVEVSKGGSKDANYSPPRLQTIIGKGFDGQLDEIMMWKVARSVDEIKSDMNKGLTGNKPPSELLWYLKLNDGPGSKSAKEYKNAGLPKYTNLINVDVNTDWVKSSREISLNTAVPKESSALDFNQANSFLDVPGTIDLANKSFTIEFLAKRKGAGKQDLFITQGSQSNSKGLSIGFQSNDQFTFAFYADDLNSPTYTDTDWHHWAVTFDANTKKQIIYRDGKQVAERTAGGNYTGTGKLTIGKNIFNTNFNGTLDDIRIWKVARSAADIEKFSKTKLVGLPTDLLRWFKLDDGKGSTSAKDEVGNASAQLTNINENTDWVTDWAADAAKRKREKEKPGFMTFAGKSGSVDAGELDFAGASGVTLEAWIRRTTEDGVEYKVIQSDKFPIKLSMTNAGVSTDGGLMFTYNTEQLKTNIVPHSNKKWHHIAATYDGTTMKIYLDGYLQAEKTYQSTISLKSQFFIADNQCSNLKGDIDEVAIWKEARSEAQIQQDLKGIKGKHGNLLRYYNFNYDDNKVIKDKTGNKDGKVMTCGGGGAPKWTKGSVPTSVTKPSVVMRFGSDFRPYYNIPYLPNFTYATWIKFEDTGKQPNTNLFKSVKYNHGIFSISSDGRLKFFGRSGNSTRELISWKPFPKDDKWHHIALVVEQERGRANATIYIDGEPAGDGFSLKQFGISARIEIGKSGTQMDDILLLKTASTAGQIKDYMKNGYSGPANQAILNFNFEGLSDGAMMKKFRSNIPSHEHGFNATYSDIKKK